MMIMSTAGATPIAFSSSLLLQQPQAGFFTSSGITKSCHYVNNRTSRHQCGCIAVSVNEQGSETRRANNKQQEKGTTSNAFEIETLTTWLLNQERQGNIDSELAIVLSSISLACKQITSLLQRATLSNLTGSQGFINIQGEDQRKLDFIANQVFCNCLRSTGRTGIIASEEEDVPIAIEETYSGNYTVVFDPIDGSSNIDTGLTTGSIFGIYSPDDQEPCLVDYDDEDDDEEDHSDQKLGKKEQKCVVSACQPGSNLLAAGYCMYSTMVVFTLSIGNGVFAFTLDPMYGEFVLTHKNIQMPKSGKIYSFNEANYELWDDKLKKYIDDIKDTKKKQYAGRYIGCLVGEVHRMLLCGGIYGNPSNTKRKQGNLRLLYECAPMSYLVEQAGGKASDGRCRILDIKPDEIHQRAPLFIGSPEEMDKLEKYLS
ncbi:hypothetical protein C5167_007607 [Papaver somniferum]|uniref:fructose-1,6-bisphosphatase, chloroplastic-like n=1 Tax=Papaver somniferum TaxID=3469 RepID=UPI000E7003AF|nr:fructose-1,6-bisphosphatase, chloroplastic-like [Papaver somniferum]RZC93563.1 hypothetical protein C5167_007607 [Papaver somniferum]